MPQGQDDVRRRTIYSRFSSRQIPDLLQTVFVAELLAPSRCLWLVSPWVSDIAVLDNSGGELTALEPEWPLGAIPITSVLLRLMELGTTVHLVSRDIPHNRPVRVRLRDAAEARALPFRLHSESDLHEKGLLADDFFIHGSMNFTFNGISVNSESVTLTTDKKELADHQLAFTREWGGAVK
jgi:phosphatidylserine/phosphatidylglycerophosphate/cardiolipin synthase-like enzyme